MRGRAALAALALLWTGAADARHSNAVLDPRAATPGVSVELIELPRSAPAEAAKYRLRVTGLPSGFAFSVWTRSFGHAFRELVSGLSADASGALALTDDAGIARRLGDIELGPGPYPRGAAWWVAVASDDHKVAAFARVIPYPIAAFDGTCSVSLELISLHGNRFAASAAGFPPGEDVEIESHASGTVSRRRLRVPADGRLPLDVIAHGTLGSNSVARYTVKARACAPSVEYTWGEHALKDH